VTLPGTRDHPEQVSLTVKLIDQFNMKELSDHVNGKNIAYKDRGAAEAMNMVVSKAVADGSPETFMATNNKFFYRPGWNGLKPVKHGLTTLRGYWCSVRPGMGTVTVNVNTLTSCFYRPQTVAKYIEDRFGTKQLDASDLKTLNKHLGGLRVYINFNRSQKGQDGAIDEKERRTMTIHGIGKHASGIKIKSAETNVLDYLKDKYPAATQKIGTTHGAIAVNVGAKHPNEKYYLANQLTVMSDQMY
jgi:eukaryotic translation initiation factor 2C